ncbi:breakpoint cluster region protein isoform X2 [Denticeps clupeoides]|uniref:Active breakpoint cluster region-related protein n=1 Tax=Denticeps clupeoides TaxID=299321 RepID=A0AAY4AMI8_9TELE|nr:breakpoint cluster region protein-like isoform X2 [Denticeps clupeoides]
MDLYEEALDYLHQERVAVEDVSDDIEGSDLLEDVFVEEADRFSQSPLQMRALDISDTPVEKTPENMEKRLMVLKEILTCEELYLNELETLLMPMKALKASAGTSQPVLSSQDVQTLFYQVPELLDLHQDFCKGLKARLEMVMALEEDHTIQLDHGSSQLCVGDLFLKIVSQLAVYRGFIDNYESAVETVRRCSQSDLRFRTLAESMKSCKGLDNFKTRYTFEALLYKPLDRVTKTTLVLHDLLKNTPPDHSDRSPLQEALRISSNFLSGLNDTSHCKKAVTLSKGMTRQLMRDGFLACACDGGPGLRHLFLYTDLLLCTKLKSAGKHAQYRYNWHVPLAGLKLHWAMPLEQPAELQQRITNTRTKMYHLRQDYQHQKSKGVYSRTLDRILKKLQECELWLLTYSPRLQLELHSLSGKIYTLLMSTLYELEEWREVMGRLIKEHAEPVPTDLLTLTNSCMKLRMTQNPHLHSLQPEKGDQALCGTLSVVIHSACGLQHPACVWVSVEVDGFEFFHNKARTHPSVSTSTPQWNQEISFQVDGAQHLMLVCVAQSDRGTEDWTLGRCSMKLEPDLVPKKWRRFTLNSAELELTLSIRYLPHPLDPPNATLAQQLPVFSVPIGLVARQEGVLVPHIVRSCVEEVERRGMAEVGIYRISASTTDVQNLKNSFNTDLYEAVRSMRSMEVNVVSGTLKLYFRDLPDPLVPREFFWNVKEALDIPDMDSRLGTMLTILNACPEVNRNTLLYLLHHLKRVADKEEVNKMSLMNLATVFGPTLLHPPLAKLGYSGPRVDISQEVVVQVQAVYFYLQCNELPAPATTLPLDTEDEQP